MATSQDPNATIAYDVVSAPADTTPPADNFSSELSPNDEPTGEAAETTPADGRPMSQKEKVKVGGLGAAAGAAAGVAGTVAAMTYGADTLHSLEEAGTDALHSVENFLGFNTDPGKPVPPAPPAPEPAHGPENGPHGPGPDPHAPTHPTNQPANQEAHHPPVAPPAPQPEPQQQLENQLVDLDGDGKADAIVVDDHGTMELVIDMDHDGQVDAVGVDTDHDGQVDAILVDADHDGIMDYDKIDTNHDGTFDTIMVDTDGDHGLDTVVTDSNQDGQFTAEDQQAATGHDIEATFSNDQGLAVNEIHGAAEQPANNEDIAHTDQGEGHENYNNEGDVHEWA